MKIRRKRKDKALPVPRLDPSVRLCANFDSAGLALYPIAEPGEMGFVVVDNFPEEHIQ